MSSGSGMFARVLGLSALVGGGAALLYLVVIRHLSTIPLPMVNILSGGLHAGRQFEFQDFMAVPHGFPRYSDSLRAVVAIHHATRELLEHILVEEEKHVDWIETQLHQIEEVGYQNYLAQQIDE